MYCSISSLRNVPKHSRGIHDIGDPKPPGLQGRRARRWDIEFSGQIELTDVRPPSVKIIDHELHHKIFSPILLVMALKYETAGAGLENRDIFVEKFFETQCLIELLRQIKVSCRYEWACEFSSARNLFHRLFFPLAVRTNRCRRSGQRWSSLPSITLTESGCGLPHFVDCD